MLKLFLRSHGGTGAVVRELVPGADGFVAPLLLADSTPLTASTVRAACGSATLDEKYLHRLDFSAPCLRSASVTIKAGTAFPEIGTTISPFEVDSVEQIWLPPQSIFRVRL